MIPIQNCMDAILNYCSFSKIVLIEDENAHARRFGGRGENGLG